jgi:plasmid stabilization system protein ParE
MAASYIVVPEVERDLLDAYDWYEERRFGLGEEFLTNVDACIQSICRNPDRYEVVHESYRRALVRRFPYAIFFEYSGSLVTIYCIVHTARDADKWRGRLP